MPTDVYQAEAPHQMLKEELDDLETRLNNNHAPHGHAIADDVDNDTGNDNGERQDHLNNNGMGPSTTTTTTTTADKTDRPQTATSTAEIDTALSHPGSVRINVKGAFIVDQDSASSGSGSGCSDSSNAGGASSITSPAEPTSGRTSPTPYETKDIRLPNHTAVVSHIAIDIGGSLAKLVYFSREAHSTEPGGRLNFVSFETDHIEQCLEFMRQLKRKHQALNGNGGNEDHDRKRHRGTRSPGELCVMATGGGAYKYYDMIRDVLGVDVLREDEMECLIIGLDFFITEIPREVFTYSETDPMHFVLPSENVYPYLLVNIGSGVSFLKVSGPRDYQRVGGTSLGGGTLWGLLSLLTGARTFDEMLDLASRGDNSKVDMLVGDIYGTDYGKIGLKSTTIASSFGKVFRMKRQAENEAEDSGGLRHADHEHEQHKPPAVSSSQNGDRDTQEEHDDHQPDSHHEHSHDHSKPFSNADVSRSLLYAISNNIGQIAFLQSQIHSLSHIYFGGSFIRGHPQTMNTLSFAIKFWSKGATQAYFLRHEGYLGAVGAFLKRQPHNWGRRGSFEESGALQTWVRARTRESAIDAGEGVERERGGRGRGRGRGDVER